METAAAVGNTEMEAPAGADTAAAVGRIYTERAPAGADTAEAVGKYRKGSCGSRYCCGSGKIQKGLLREQILLRQWKNIERAPAGAFTTAAVREIKKKGSCGSGNRCGGVRGRDKSTCGSRYNCGSGERQEGSCGSRHHCGSGERQKGSCGSRH
ncbi:MAG: hypothetical protein ACRCSI_04240 [Eubacterium aggregans]